MISVPTPLSDGAPELSYIEDAARALGGCLQGSATVILESTTYPPYHRGAGRSTAGRSLGLVAGQYFHLGYSPERIDPGNPRWHFKNTAKVVSGID